MNKNTTVTTETQPKRRTTPKWAGTPGYSNVNYVASQPVSKFNEMLFDGDCGAGDDSDMLFAAKR